MASHCSNFQDLFVVCRKKRIMCDIWPFYFVESRNIESKVLGGMWKITFENKETLSWPEEQQWYPKIKPNESFAGQQISLFNKLHLLTTNARVVFMTSSAVDIGDKTFSALRTVQIPLSANNCHYNHLKVGLLAASPVATGELIPPKQSSKSSQIEIWNTINSEVCVKFRVSSTPVLTQIPPLKSF